MTQKQIEQAEAQLAQNKRKIHYNTRIYPVAEVLRRYKNAIAGETKHKTIYSNLQKNIAKWDIQKQSKFIESLLLGLPITLLYAVETETGRFEIIDGAERLHALYLFVANELKLSGLTRLDALNDFSFNDLSTIVKEQLNSVDIRFIVFSGDTSQQLQDDIIERVHFLFDQNKGSRAIA